MTAFESPKRVMEQSPDPARDLVPFVAELCADPASADHTFGTRSEAFTMGFAVAQHLSQRAVRGERRTAGARIDPQTATVWFEYAQALDPYGDDPIFPEELSCIGREWFACSPDECIRVHFNDLPEQIRAQLEEKRRVADRRGWDEVRGLIAPMIPLSESVRARPDGRDQ